MFRALIIGLILLGLVARAAPFLDAGNRLLEQFVTEDGYFMLAIARNLAIGKGFSIADGEVPTNGTQPLTTLLYSLGFMLVSGAKKAGVAVAQVMQLVAAIAAGWLLYRLGKKVFAKRPEASHIAALGAATWFASPVTLPHSMNGLETGFYALIAVVVGLRFVESDDTVHEPWGLWDNVASGVLLGTAFWVRNDAVFLILAACLTYLFSGAHLGIDVVARRFGRTLVFGSLSVLVASPWLAFNYRLFGHIMPVSGRAENLTAELFHNTLEVPPVLLEYFAVFVPVPQTYEEIPLVAAACVLPLVVLGLTVIRSFIGTPHRTERTLIVLAAIYTVCLSCFYGLYFGAGWFMARYLFPTSPFLALGWAAAVILWIVPRFSSTAVRGLAVGLVAVCVLLNVRTYQRGHKHAHFQVIEWAETNLPPAMWSGAIQTGTLGFFHDRTVNLDGKVNIDAYYAVKNDRSGAYAVTTDVEYLLDWIGMADWLTRPAIEAEFRTIVNDTERNLAVLQRRDRIRLGPELAADRNALDVARRQNEAALEQLQPGTEAQRWGLLLQLAWIEEALARPEPALDWARRSLELCRIQSGKPGWRDREIDSRRKLATLLRARHDLPGALEQSEQALALIARTSTSGAALDLPLSWLEEGELRWELAELSRAEGDTAGERTNLDRAQKRFSEAHARLDGLPDGTPGRARALAVSKMSLGDIALRMGALDEAEAYFEASSAIRKRLYDARPHDRQTTFDYALAEARRGRLAFLRGDKPRSAVLINESIRLRRSLPKPNPGASEPPPLRAWTFTDGLLGISSVARGKTTER